MLRVSLPRDLLQQASQLLRMQIHREAAAPATPPHADPLNPQLSAESVLSSHTALLRWIRVAYGYPHADFAQHLLSPITALAAWLHFLPGHPGGGFERRGGALEQALTNCLFSLQAAEGRTFNEGQSGGSPENKSQCWRLACALGGLFANLADVLTRIEVASDDGVLWPGEALPLLQWLESLHASRYHYRWKRMRVPGHKQALYAAVRCIDPAVMSFLVEGNADIAQALLATISFPAGTSDDPVSDVVSKIAVAVAAHERSDSASAPPDDLLVSTLKRLFATSDWLPNSPGGHVWYGQDGLYLLWPEASMKIMQSVPKGARAIPGFGSHDDFLGHLTARGLIAATPLPQVSIRPPGSTKPHAAVRVLEPSQLFPGGEPRATALQFRLALLDSHSVGSVESESSLLPACAEEQTLSKADDQERTLAIEPNISGREQAVTVAELAARDAPQELTLDTSRILNPGE